MSIVNCFRLKIATGRVDVDAGQKLLGWLDEARTELADKMAAAEASRMAAADTVKRAAYEAERQAELALRSIETRVEGTGSGGHL